MREAPAVSEVRPEATAASWSARSRGNPSDIARRSPSAETTTVWDTPGVLSTKLVINQFRFCAAWLIGLTLTLLVVGAVRTRSPAVRVTTCVASLLDAASQVAQPAPDVLRGAGDLGAALRGRLRRALDQIGLGHPPGQTGRGDPARLRLPELARPAASARRWSSASRRSRSRPAARATAAAAVPAAAAAAVLRRTGRFRGPWAASAADRPGAADRRRSSRWPTCRGGTRTVEAYALLRLGGSARGRFRFGLRYGLVRTLVRVLICPLVLVGLGGELVLVASAECSRTGRHMRLPDSRRCDGVAVCDCSA